MEKAISDGERNLVKMRYLVTSKHEIDMIDNKLKMIPPEIQANVLQARLMSHNELHITMRHQYFNKFKEITLPKTLGRLLEIESIPTGNKNELVMGIKIELEDGSKLFMLFEHIEVIMRVKFE